MNHYDGPAFYRRFLNHAMGKSAFKDQPPTRHIRHKQIHLKDDDVKTNNLIAKMTDEFKPSKSYQHHSGVTSFYNSNHPHLSYAMLKKELYKTPDSYILIQPSNSKTLQQSNTAKESFKSHLNSSSAEPSNQSNLYTSDEEHYFAKNNDIGHKQDINDHSSGSLQSNDISSAKKIDSSQNTSQIQNSSASSVAAISKTVHSSDSNLSNSKSKYGLGNTLSSILDDENNNHQSKLFHDSNSSAIQSESENLNQEKAADYHEINSNSTNNDFIKSDSSATSDEHKEIQQIQPSKHGYHFPNPQFLNQPKHFKDEHLNEWIRKQAQILNKTLAAFNVDAEVVDWTNGPTVTQFQVKLKLGVKVSKITNLTDDLKLALAAKDIRIEAPIPGQTTVGIEIPNPKPRPVLLSEVVNSDKFQKSNKALTVALGVDLTGQPQVTDIRKMPHGLIAGATGSGKSVFINSLLVSLLYRDNPSELRLILIDPKAVELAPYNGIPHLLSPVISDPKQASAALKWAVKEMDQRYERLAAGGVRNIEQYNQAAEKHHQYGLKMPYIVIVIDELADLMMVASTEVEDYIVRITQKARAAGIHLIVATQRPSVDIITGTIKNNIPTRIAFMVSSQVDSRTIIDSSGADRLLGKGDMLYVGSGSSQPIRLQGTFVGNQEIERVTDFIRKQGHPNYAFQPKSLLKHVDEIENQDKLMPQVLKYISNEKTISTSKLQRFFSIGYNRAASLIDDLEQNHYVSEQHGSKPRDVYFNKADYQKLNQ